MLFTPVTRRPLKDGIIYTVYICDALAKVSKSFILSTWHGNIGSARLYHQLCEHTASTRPIIYSKYVLIPAIIVPE